MKKKNYVLKSQVTLYPGMAGWHFIYVSKKESEEIKKNFSDVKKGWGSIPVTVTLGKSTWDTSIFPDKKSGTYLLLLKAKVRMAEGIRASDTIIFSLKIRA